MTAADVQDFAAALARLDDGDYPPGDAGTRLHACDVALANRYDRMLRAVHNDYLDTLRRSTAEVAS